MPDGSRSFGRSSPDLDRVAVLFRAHFGFVRRVLQRCGVAEADLDDAVQEVFLVVHRRIDDFQGRSSETTWLYAVAVRVASTLRRSASREHARRSKVGEQMHSASEADPERELSRAQAAALLDRLLDDLDSTKRTVFVLAELEGVPVPEIAQIMAANVRTTHSRLRLARKRFNDALLRHHAQESSRVRRASVRTLARRSEPAATEPARTRAAWAALAVRISDGATPMAISWMGAGATATASAFWLPFALTVGLGAAGLGVAAISTDSDARSTRSIPSASGDSETNAARVPVVSVASERRDVLAPAPPQESAALVSAEHLEPSTVVKRHGTGPAKAGRAPTTRAPEPDADDISTLEAEAALLETARADLRASKPSKALGALEEHRTRFPNGLLATERRATRVKALCLAGRVVDAQRAAGTDPGLRAVFDAACE
ncbi:MAG: RNA polymerase sigma factor [Nannocystaceae bacterium]|nr:RNA polymerase sigma factor [Nannocystaceae bacterium]